MSGWTARVVRVVPVDQRVELQTEELRVLEKALGLVDVAGHARVPPHEPVCLRDRLDDRADVLVVGMEDATTLVAVLLDQRREPVAVERDVEHRAEVADVRVSVEDRPSRRPPFTRCPDRSASVRVAAVDR